MPWTSPCLRELLKSIAHNILIEDRRSMRFKWPNFRGQSILQLHCMRSEWQQFLFS